MNRKRGQEVLFFYSSGDCGLSTHMPRLHKGILASFPSSKICMWVMYDTFLLWRKLVDDVRQGIIKENTNKKAS